MGNKQVVCKLCEKTFSPGRLKDHMISKYGEKGRNQCNMCEKTFHSNQEFTFIQVINLTSAVNVRKHSEQLLTEIHMNNYMIKLNMCLLLFVINKPYDEVLGAAQFTERTMQKCQKLS